jgi:hypothetical protein
MARSKYIMPVARVLTSIGVLITAGIRQASPEGSPLTVAIFGSAFVTMMQGVFDFRKRWNEVEKVPTVAELESVQVEPVKPFVKETGTKFQDMVKQTRPVREVA